MTFSSSNETGRIGRLDRVRGQFRFALGRRGLLELLEGRFDRGLAGRRSQHHQAFIVLVDRDFGLRGDLAEQVEHFGRRFLFERIELQLGRLRIGRVGPQFLQRGFDPFVIGRPRPRRPDAVGWRPAVNSASGTNCWSSVCVAVGSAPANGYASIVRASPAAFSSPSFSRADLTSCCSCDVPYTTRRLVRASYVILASGTSGWTWAIMASPAAAVPAVRTSYVSNRG